VLLTVQPVNAAILLTVQPVYATIECCSRVF
jgi:hypothetical protein